LVFDQLLKLTQPGHPSRKDKMSPSETSPPCNAFSQCGFPVKQADVLLQWRSAPLCLHQWAHVSPLSGPIGLHQWAHMSLLVGPSVSVSGPMCTPRTLCNWQHFISRIWQCSQRL